MIVGQDGAQPQRAMLHDPEARSMQNHLSVWLPSLDAAEVKKPGVDAHCHN